MDKYGFILNLPHPVSKTRQRMSMDERAAQFSPFAPLRTHADAIWETQRLTQPWAGPSGEEQDELNRKTALLLREIGSRPPVSVTYFVPDEKKDGGAYVTHAGDLRRIDVTAGLFIFADGTAVEMRYIVEIRDGKGR